MILTGSQMNEKLTRIRKQLEKLKEANVVDATTNDLVCITVEAAMIKMDISQMDRNYTNALQLKNFDEKYHS